MLGRITDTTSLPGEVERDCLRGPGLETGVGPDNHMGAGVGYKSKKGNGSQKKARCQAQ